MHVASSCFSMTLQLEARIVVRAGILTVSGSQEDAISEPGSLLLVLKGKWGVNIGTIMGVYMGDM